MDRAEVLEKAEAALEYQFKDRSILDTALTHASCANTRLESNERLEFLGDAILSAVVCKELFRKYPHYLEGELTKIKSAVVSRHTCALAANRLGLPDLLFVGKGMSGRTQLPSSLAAASFESVIAAIYLDSGTMAAARDFILKQIGEVIVEAAASEHQRNFKSQLQQHAQKHFGATPVYELLDEQGPDHSKCFEMCVVVGGRRFPSAWGPSKKEAEQKAAFRALKQIGVVEDEEEPA
ncbi:MAG: ribonuclease III [Phycisphaerae bacterium]|nr:ribonuclease III [Phycisphaerae bacterium]